MYRYGEGIFNRPLRYSPLTLTTLASLVPPELDIEVEIIDEGVESFQSPSVMPDLVGISAITGSSHRAYYIADYFRNNGVPVVLGGVHPTLMPEEAIQHSDSVVAGFAEESWPQLLRDFKNGKMKKLYTQSPDMRLEKLPIPRRDLLRRRKSYVTIHTIQATRGCKNLCDFCVVPVAWGQRMYLRPIPEVIKEIEQIEGKNLLFVDVSPIEDIGYAKELYRAMIPLRKRWVSPCTMSIADDPELLSTAAKSGCKGLLLGFESVSQATLKGMRKNFNSANKYKEQVKKLHDNGIAINACFVFGFDTDDKDVFDRTVEFSIKLNLDIPRYTVYTPFPGTPVYKRLKDEGRIIEDNWALYDAQHVVFKPRLMSPEELQEGLHRAWRETYRFSSIIKRLSNSRIILAVTLPGNIAYREYARKLPWFTKDVMGNIDKKGVLGAL